MTFDKVLPSLKKGKKISRKCWEDRLMLFKVDDLNKKDVVYIYGKGHKEHNNFCSVFYKFAQDDILADDWYVL